MGADGNLGHGGFRVGRKHLGPVADDTTKLLVGARHIAGDVNQGEQRDVEGITEADESGSFV
ncbi:hypothetical protein ES703_58118 [subsurface metagenome]